MSKYCIPPEPDLMAQEGCNTKLSLPGAMAICSFIVSKSTHTNICLLYCWPLYIDIKSSAN